MLHIILTIVRKNGYMKRRVVVISGGSSGIGRATVERFLLSGDFVVNLDKSKPPTEHENGSVWKPVDVRDWSSVSEVVRNINEEYGKIDTVIANAGISIRRSVLELKEEDARRVVDTNLIGVLALWTHAAKYMVQQKSGVLLATSSVNGARGYPFYADYNATKAGIAALCRTFAIELSPHIRVSCVSPGAVETPMQLAEYTDEMFDAVNSSVPLKRHAAPHEIAEAFFFLASDNAQFITGHELVVDGGETIGATTTKTGTAFLNASER